MTSLSIRRLFTLAALAAAGLPAQDWTDEQLVAQAKGFQSPSLTTQIEQVGSLLAQRERAFTPVAARLHGDYREYRLKIDRLLEELCAPNWKVRESAERALARLDLSEAQREGDSPDEQRRREPEAPRRGREPSPVGGPRASQL